MPAGSQQSVEVPGRELVTHMRMVAAMANWRARVRLARGKALSRVQIVTTEKFRARDILLRTFSQKLIFPVEVFWFLKCMMAKFKHAWI